MYKPKIILASQSPRRSQILQWADVPFEVIVADTDESYPASLAPAAAAAFIAVEKAMAVRSRLQPAQWDQDNRTIIAADTIVVLGDQIIGKPADRAQAIATLESLSGKTHKVITGVCLLTPGEKVVFSDETLVEFHPLSLDQVVYYVDHYHPYDKAGAYAIQEWIGVVGIRSISGDFYNVMGLPVSRVIMELGNLNRSAAAPRRKPQRGSN